MGRMGLGRNVYGFDISGVNSAGSLIYSRSKRGGGIAGRSTSETPLDILKKRYAKGEISKEDYEKIRKDLL